MEKSSVKSNHPITQSRIPRPIRGYKKRTYESTSTQTSPSLLKSKPNHFNQTYTKSKENLDNTFQSPEFSSTPAKKTRKSSSSAKQQSIEKQKKNISRTDEKLKNNLITTLPHQTSHSFLNTKNIESNTRSILIEENHEENEPQRIHFEVTLDSSNDNLINNQSVKINKRRRSIKSKSEGEQTPIRSKNLKAKKHNSLEMNKKYTETKTPHNSLESQGSSSSIRTRSNLIKLKFISNKGNVVEDTIMSEENDNHISTEQTTNSSAKSAITIIKQPPKILVTEPSNEIETVQDWQRLDLSDTYLSDDYEPKNQSVKEHNEHGRDVTLPVKRRAINKRLNLYFKRNTVREQLGLVEKELYDAYHPNTRLRRSERLRMKRISRLQEERVKLLDEINLIENEDELLQGNVNLKNVTLRPNNPGYKNKKVRTKETHKQAHNLSTLREE